MYSKVEYIGPNYRQSLPISLPGYPRGYTSATVAPMTDHQIETNAHAPVAAQLVAAKVTLRHRKDNNPYTQPDTHSMEGNRRISANPRVSRSKHTISPQGVPLRCSENCGLILRQSSYVWHS